MVQREHKFDQSKGKRHAQRPDVHKDGEVGR